MRNDLFAPTLLWLAYIPLHLPYNISKGLVKNTSLLTIPRIVSPTAKRYLFKVIV